MPLDSDMEHKAVSLIGDTMYVADKQYNWNGGQL